MAGRRLGGIVPEPDERRPTTFRLMVVPGVTVDKWSRIWSQRLPDVELQVVPAEATEAAAALPTQADAGVIRLPVDQETFHAIRLYTETTVVVVPRDHLLTAEDGEVTLADLVDETLLYPLDDMLDWPTGLPTDAVGVAAAVHPERPATAAAAVELVAAGVGVLVTTQSLARLYHRRDVTYRVVSDAPTSSVALVWRRDRQTALVEEMIGIVRGRTENSTRGRVAAPADTVRPAQPAQSGRGRAKPRPPRRRGR